MTVSEAILKTQGSGVGFLNRLSVKYAQTILEPGESVSAAVIANIFTRKERFPGVVALTDRRVLAVCGLPGIRRCVSCALGSLETRKEKPTAIRYQASFSDEGGAFSMTVDPDTGEKFSRRIAALKGEADEFDAAGGEADSFLLNPTLVRNQRRARRARERARREVEKARKTAEIPPSNRESAQETAERLAMELEEAKKKGRVKDTDPKAVAARLAAELAGEETENKR